MKKTLVLTVVMILALSLFAWAAETKIKITDTVNIDNSTTSKGIVIDKEELLYHTSGEASVFAALTEWCKFMSGKDPQAAIPIQEFLNELKNAPAGSAVYTSLVKEMDSGKGDYIAADGSKIKTPNLGASHFSGEVVAGRGKYYYATSPGEIHTVQDNTTTTSKTVNKGGGIYNVTTNITSGTKYKTFGNAYCSPIVLDLDGDGKLEASNGIWTPHAGMLGNTAIFDITGDGFDEVVEWVGPNDGILFFPDENPEINGKDLFGTVGGYTDGYQKLSLYDKDKNGVLSGDELAGMKVWTDKNGNARVDAGEVKTLGELGITELALSHTDFTSSFVQNGVRKYSWDWFPTYCGMELVSK